MAQSVTNYLMTQYEATVLSANELRTSVSEVLATIGYAEVAAHFSPTRPPRDISLVELVARSGAHELTLFSMLREILTNEIQGGINDLTLIHLSHAVKQLLGVKLFNEECTSLRQEIVSYVRCFVANQTTANILIR